MAPGTCRGETNRGKDRGGNEQVPDATPQTMLMWRAVSIGCRLEAPELMKGMRSAEEMADEVALDAVEVTATVGPAAQLEASDITAPRTAAPTADPLAGLRVMELVREAEASTRLDGETALCQALRRSGRRVTFRRKAFPRITPSQSPSPRRSGGASTTPSPSWV